MTCRRLLVISDTHCGSTRALCPPDFRTNEGQRVGLSKAQKWLWAQWLDFQAWAEQIGEFALVVNGDIIEGNHHRTTEIISPDVSDHFECALATFAPIIDLADRVYVVRGTETHTGPTSEVGLARVWKAVYNERSDSHAGDRLDIEFAKVRCRFVHHGVGTRREWTRASAMNIDLASHKLTAIDAGNDPPRILGLGHFHHYAMYADDRGLCFRTPSWQWHTRHTMKVVPWAELQVGAVMLDWSEVADGELPIVRPFIRRPNEG